MFENLKHIFRVVGSWEQHPRGNQFCGSWGRREKASLLLVGHTEPWWWEEEAWALEKGILAVYTEAQCLLLHGHSGFPGGSGAQE